VSLPTQVWILIPPGDPPQIDPLVKNIKIAGVFSLAIFIPFKNNNTLRAELK
jgi:hypothetical protein